MSTPADLQRRLDETFAAFRASLEDMLAAEARRHLEATVERLKRTAGPFTVETLEVDVVIRELRLAAADPAAAPGRRRRTGTSAERGARGGRAGRERSPKPSVRATLLAAFPAEGEMDTAQLRRALEAQGVTTSVDNVHQQLRRLVQAGELERAGRGHYRRGGSATPEAA